jgi:hypothetical protein
MGSAIGLVDFTRAASQRAPNASSSAFASLISGLPIWRGRGTCPKRGCGLRRLVEFGMATTQAYSRLQGQKALRPGFEPGPSLFGRLAPPHLSSAEVGAEVRS